MASPARDVNVHQGTSRVTGGAKKPGTARAARNAALANLQRRIGPIKSPAPSAHLGINLPAAPAMDGDLDDVPTGPRIAVKGHTRAMPAPKG